MNALFKFYSMCVIISMFISINAVAQEQVYKWISISGKWELRLDNKASYLLESKSKTYLSGYSELINYNSLITQQTISNPSSIQFTFSIMNPILPTENLFFFNAESFRSFYAIKLSGDGKLFNKVSLINSKINDTTLPRSVRNNYIITELSSKECTLEYNTDYNAEIIFKRKKTLIFKVNGKELLSEKIPGEISVGKIGFSNRNAILKISNLKVFSEKKVVFEDDFSTDTIKRLKVTAKKISETEGEKKK